MNDLHPRDEIAVRQSTCQITLNAKQIQAAQVAAEIAEWQARGNRIGQVQGHSGQAIPFNPTKCKDKTQSYKFEITPEGKPKKQFKPQKLEHPQQSRALDKRRAVVECIKQHGAMTVPQIAAALGYNRSTMDAHIKVLVSAEVIGYAQITGNCRYFDLADNCNSNIANTLKNGNHNRTRGEVTRAQIVDFMLSQARPLTIKEIAAAVGLSGVTINEHVNHMCKIRKLQSSKSTFGSARLYEVVK